MPVRNPGLDREDVQLPSPSLRRLGGSDPGQVADVLQAVQLARGHSADVSSMVSFMKVSRKIPIGAA
jgi:hypothetical protein